MLEDPPSCPDIWPWPPILEPPPPDLRPPLDALFFFFFALDFFFLTGRAAEAAAFFFFFFAGGAFFAFLPFVFDFAFFAMISLPILSCRCRYGFTAPPHWHAALVPVSEPPHIT